jgi:hypothetical protein
MNAIYLIEENTSIVESVRRLCMYDLWISGKESSEAKEEVDNQSVIKQYISLMEKLNQDSSLFTSFQSIDLDAGDWSHFVSLTFASIDDAVPILPSIRIGADALELRVDLLRDISPISLHRQIALLRKICPLPIVFTVRSIGQIGKFPEDPVKIFSLLREGLRAAAEWVDVEACWPESTTREFTHLAKSYCKTSRLLGTYLGFKKFQ